MVSDEGAGLERNLKRSRAWVEPTATILIATAAVLTAWSAFQSAKWNGVQAETSRQAAAAGTAASKATTIASSQRTVDVGTFLQWLQAVRDDVQADRVDPSAGPYVADPRTLSGFIAVRFRDEFKPAFDAWIATRPLVNSGAPATPFELPEYTLAADAQANRLTNQAETSVGLADRATHRAENYVQLTVVFAIALVVANIGSKLSRSYLNAAVLGLAWLIVFVAVVTLATYPVRF